MPNLIIFTKLFIKLGYTVFSICDGRLITGDHWILVGCNTFLWASTASSRDVTAIKKAIKIFSLACKWSIVRSHYIASVLLSFQQLLDSKIFVTQFAKTLHNGTC